MTTVWHVHSKKKSATEIEFITMDECMSVILYNFCNYLLKDYVETATSLLPSTIIFYIDKYDESNEFIHRVIHLLYENVPTLFAVMDFTFVTDNESSKKSYQNIVKSMQERVSS